MNHAGQKMVLVVEDDEDLQEGIAVLLHGAGFTPLVVGCGEAAVPALNTHQISLVLLDVQLPGINGFEVLRQVKQHPQHLHVPVIMLTTEAKDNQILEGYGIGADYYIPKPFNKEQLHFGIKLCVAD